MSETTIIRNDSGLHKVEATIGKVTHLPCPDCNCAHLRIGSMEYSSLLLVCPNCGFRCHPDSTGAA